MTTTNSSDAKPMQHSWQAAFGALCQAKVLVLFLLGFSAGIPILLIFSSLSVWLREAEVARSTVTFFSWAALGYSFKFVWAPLVDKLPLPWLHAILGRRRSWLLLSQFAIIASILFMATNDPQQHLVLMALGAVLLGFSSATQDIVIDAYRIEAADKDMQALLSSAYVMGYRIGMLAAGAGALKLATWFASGEGYEYGAWALTYTCMAGVMLIGVLTTLSIREPDIHAVPTSSLRSNSDYVRFVGLFFCVAAAFIVVFWLSADSAQGLKAWLIHELGWVKALAGTAVEALRLAGSVALALLVAWGLIKAQAVPQVMVQETYIAPFADFIHRYGKAGLLLLVLIGTYRIADIVMGVMANVFYVDIGFSKDQIANIAKTFGLLMTIVGGFAGGILAVRYGVLKTLFLGALLAAVTNILFAILASVGNSSELLIVVIAADNLAGGLATTAFVAYLSSLTNVAFTATQYALFSSIMTLFPKILAGYMGMVVDSVGYEWFFIGTAVLGLPVLGLIWLVGRLELQT